MLILVNGQPRDVAADTLQAALSELGYGGQRVATALDGEFVAETRRCAQALHPNCRLEILTPMQGG